ncbi:MAG TPA: DNA ligase D [Gaiellaceae bacterium]|nr:DNA ligase D [Gaiellaceae bacterium]
MDNGDSLGEYRRKRKPGETPEPFSGGAPGAAPIFVVQRHDARRLHYDFRLEEDGVLASWAVPKGVPLDPGARALAVHVEDHPLEYGSFEGEIPAGQYGAGSVELWDTGPYELVERRGDGRRTVVLHGKRLRGTWSLIPAHLDGKEENWLLIKRRDGEADAAPREYSPMLATSADSVPTGSDWRYEVKFDGYRALAFVRAGDCRLVSRNGNDLTQRFAEVAKAVVSATKSPNAVLDGEVCRIDANGRASFSELQQGSGALVFYVFDLLEVDGEPIIEAPFEERKDRLRALLDARNTTVRVSDDFADGAALFQAAQERGLEGVVAKRSGSPYRPGRRTREWLKVKATNSDEFVVVGYTRGAGRREGTFGSLVLGLVEDGELRYVGNVGTGFDDAEITRLLRALRPLHRETTPFAVEPKLPRVRKGDVQWVEPKLIAQVRYGEWTHDRRLRHPSYLGLRDDKAPEEVVRDDVVRRGRRELKLSNLEKLFWPDEGITKGDLLRYYRELAPVLVPHLSHRPFTMRRYPDGAYGKAFFQKDAPSHMPDWIPRFRARVSVRDDARTKRWIEFPVVDDELALLWMVNMGCIDMNAWYSRIDRPDRPDFVLFDLDPTPEVPWTQTVEVALILKQLLDTLALESFPKTSGGKGIHVLVPLDRRSTYDDSRSFAEVVAGAIVRAHPKLATTEWSKARRRGVLIDANQNGEGKTIASAYSVRPHPGAPVSTPLRWDEVNERLDPATYTMDVVRERVRVHGDLFAEVLTTRQSLSKALRSLA